MAMKPVKYKTLDHEASIRLNPKKKQPRSVQQISEDELRHRVASDFPGIIDPPPGYRDEYMRLWTYLARTYGVMMVGPELQQYQRMVREGVSPFQDMPGGSGAPTSAEVKPRKKGGREKPPRRERKASPFWKITNPSDEIRTVQLTRYGSGTRQAEAYLGDDRQWYSPDGKPLEVGGWYVESIVNAAPTKKFSRAYRRALQEKWEKAVSKNFRLPISDRVPWPGVDAIQQLIDLYGDELYGTDHMAEYDAAQLMTYWKDPEIRKQVLRFEAPRRKQQIGPSKEQKTRRDNPEPHPVALDKAAKKYEEFHSFEPKHHGQFPFEVPQRMAFAGPCTWVTYRSDKWNDGTHDYIHEIESKPRVSCCMVGGGNASKSIPQSIRETQVLTQLGLKCLGWAYTDPDTGEEIEVKAPKGTEWYWSDKGKALLAIQNRKKLLAVIWGGKLDVESRGIVG